MTWEARWEVLEGPFGPRRDVELDQLWVGERVRFTLRNTEGTPQAAMRHQSWIRRPTLEVTASNGQQNTAPASEENPLQVEYHFRYEGTKTLRIRGVPNVQTVVGTSPQPATMRDNRRPTNIPLFDGVSIELRARVLPPPARPRGAEAATMQAPRDQRAREGRRVQDRERDAEARERADGQALEEQGIEEQIRALGLDDVALNRRPGVFRFAMKTEAEVAALRTLEDVEDYLLEFRHAFLATLRSNPLRFNRRALERDDRFNHYRITSHWVAEREGGSIAVFQRLTFTRTSQRIPANYVPANWEALQRDVRLRTISRYGPEEWLVADVPGEDEPAILTAGDLHFAAGIEQLSTTLTIIDGLELLFTGGVAAPEVAARRTAIRGVVAAVRRVARVGGRAAVRRLLSRRAGQALARRSQRSLARAESTREAARRAATAAHPTPEARGLEAGARATAPETAGVPGGGRATGTAIVRRITDAPGPVRWAEMHATGLTHTQVSTLRQLINEPLSSSQLRALGTHWHNAMAGQRQPIIRLQRLIAGRAQRSRVQRRARSVFGRVRQDFWRSVEADPLWRPVFEQAGIRFPGAGRSPTITMNTLEGQRTITIDIGHDWELSQNPLRGFTQHNMALQFQTENRHQLNQLISQDPFIPEARTSAGTGLSRAGRLRGTHEVLGPDGRPTRIGAPGGLLPPPSE